MAIKTISSREVYSNKWTRVREDIIERANGERGVFGVIEKDPACIVVPLERTASGEEFLWLVEQYRYTVRARFMEFPQGGWETANVDPEELARGELREETGLAAESMIKLGQLWIAYGVMHQEHHVYLAEGLREGAHDRDAEEIDLEVKRLSVRDFENALLDGTIQDNCTAAAWGLYKIWRERQNV